MLNRRQLSVACAAAVLGAHGGARAQDKWPDRPVRIVVGFAAGGGVDLAARHFADQLQDHWKQAVVVDNKPGANTLIAAQVVLGAPRDGYTLLVTNSNTFYLPAVNPAVKMRPLDEFVPLGEISFQQLVVLVTDSVPTNRLEQIIELARKNPASYAFGSYGYGTVAHLLLSELNKSKGLNLTHIPYRGTAPMVQAMLAGEGKLGVSNYGTVKGFIETGKLKPVAVYGSSRSRFMPDVPTLAELGVPGFDAPQWAGLFAPVGVPRELVERITKDLPAVMKSEPYVKRLAAEFVLPGRLVLDDFRNLVERDARALGAMSMAAGIRMGE